MVKKIIALTLSLALTLCGCSQAAQLPQGTESASQTVEASSLVTENAPQNLVSPDEDVSDIVDLVPLEDIEPYVYEPEFDSLDDEELRDYIEDNVYEELVGDLNSEGYFVENVEAIYISQEYIEEKAFNSKSNIFFGYTLEDIHEVYGDKRFVFTTNDEGKTIVTEFENYDDTYDQIVRNVAIGSGVILLCVTVSVVSGGLGAPAVSMIFAMGAKTGTIMALSCGGIGGLAAGITTQIETGDINQALKAAALEGSEQFKWGAIIGCAIGGAEEAILLKGATLNGLTMNEAALIQKESGFPIELIKQFKSIDEYNVYKNAGLYTKMVNGKIALVRDIDPNYIATLENGTQVSNLELMANGKAPFDPVTGQRYDLHHINQEKDSLLAILTKSEHTGSDAILHDKAKEGVHNPMTGDKQWPKKKADFWRALAAQYMG